MAVASVASAKCLRGRIERLVGVARRADGPCLISPAAGGSPTSAKSAHPEVLACAIGNNRGLGTSGNTREVSSGDAGALSLADTSGGAPMRETDFAPAPLRLRISCLGWFPGELGLIMLSAGMRPRRSAAAKAAPPITSMPSAANAGTSRTRKLRNRVRNNVRTMRLRTCFFRAGERQSTTLAASSSGAISPR